jgi:hypothetical protein
MRFFKSSSASARPLTPPTVQTIVTRTYEAADDRAKHQLWWKDVLDAPQETLIEATSKVRSTPIGTERAAAVKGCREAMLAEIDRRNADNVVKTMQHLDRSTEKLTWVGIILAFLALVVAIIQLLGEFHVFDPNGEGQLERSTRLISSSSTSIVSPQAALLLAATESSVSIKCGELPRDGLGSPPN